MNSAPFSQWTSKNLLSGCILSGAAGGEIAYFLFVFALNLTVKGECSVYILPKYQAE